MTDYLKKSSDIKERLETKQRSLSSGSPSAKVKDPVTDEAGENANQTTNVRTSLTQRYAINLDKSKNLESTEQKPSGYTGSKSLQSFSSNILEVTVQKPQESTEPKPLESAEQKSLESLAQKSQESIEQNPQESNEQKPQEQIASKSLESIVSKPQESTASKPLEYTQFKTLEYNAPKPLESTSAIARILGGSTVQSFQKNETIAAPSSYIKSTFETGTPSSASYQHVGNIGLTSAQQTLNNLTAQYTSKYNLGQSGLQTFDLKSNPITQTTNTTTSNVNLTSGLSGLNYKFDSKYTPISTNTYTSTGLTGLDLKSENKTDLLTTNQTRNSTFAAATFSNIPDLRQSTPINNNTKDSSTFAVATFSNIPDLKQSLAHITNNLKGSSSFVTTTFSNNLDLKKSTVPLTSASTYNIYKPTTTIVTSGDLYKNGITGISGIDSSASKMSDDYLKIVDSKLLIKEKGYTKDSEIGDIISQYLPSKSDNYGSLKVNNINNISSSITGYNSIKETNNLPYSITGGIKDSINLNTTDFKSQLQVASSPKVEQSEYQKVQTVLSKFASYQPTPQAVKTSDLFDVYGLKQSGVSGSKNTFSQANQYENIQNPIDTIDETVKRASNTVRNSQHSSASNKNLLIENNIGTIKYTTDTYSSTPIVNYQPLLLNAYASPTTVNNATVTINKNYSTEIQPASTYNNYQVSSISTNVQPTYSSVARTIEVDVFSTNYEQIIQRGEREGVEFSDSEFLPSPAHIGGSYPEWLLK